MPISRSSFHRVLGGFGLDLTCGMDERHIGQVDEQGVLAAQVGADLADGFQEGQRLDVAHRAADFHNRHIGVAGTGVHLGLDFVGDVRNHLHGTTQVVATALFGDHRFVHLAGGEVVALLHLGLDEALVVAEVQVGFGPVFSDEHLAMLERTHCPRIHVDVRIQLEHGHAKPTGFKNRCDRRSSNAFAQRGNHTAGHENVLGHGRTGLNESGILS